MDAAEAAAAGRENMNTGCWIGAGERRDGCCSCRERGEEVAERLASLGVERERVWGEWGWFSAGGGVDWLGLAEWTREEGSKSRFSPLGLGLALRMGTVVVSNSSDMKSEEGETGRSSCSPSLEVAPHRRSSSSLSPSSSEKTGIGRLLGGGEFSKAPPAHRIGVEGSARQGFGVTVLEREGVLDFLDWRGLVGLVEIESWLDEMPEKRSAIRFSLLARPMVGKDRPFRKAHRSRSSCVAYSPSCCTALEGSAWLGMFWRVVMYVSWIKASSAGPDGSLKVNRRLVDWPRPFLVPVDFD